MGNPMANPGSMVGMGNPMVPPYAAAMQNQMSNMGIGPTGPMGQVQVNNIKVLITVSYS